MACIIRALIVVTVWGVLLAGCRSETQQPVVEPVVKTLRISLDRSAQARTYTGVIVLQVEEGDLAERAQGHDASGHVEALVERLQGGFVQGLVGGQGLAGRGVSVKIVRIQMDVFVQQLTGLGHAVLEHFIELVARCEGRQEGVEPLRLVRLGGQFELGAAGIFLTSQGMTDLS